MKARTIILLSLSVCALGYLFALPFSTPPVKAQTQNYRYGFAVGDTMLGMSPAAMNARLDAMKSLGVGWLRFDISWPDIQPVNGSTYNWARMDALIAATRAHGMNVLGLLDFTPTWAASPACISAGVAHCPPGNPAAFAAFAKIVVARYKSQGVWAWEIWDEPNNGFFWGPKADCTAYTSLLKVTYPAIKSADQYATIITGGLSPASTDGTNISPTDFLSCIYNNGGKNYFSMVGDHPYTFPLIPSNYGLGSWGQMFYSSPNLWHIMVSNNDITKKIWITEFGAPTNGPDPRWFVSEGAQSAMMIAAINLYKTYSWTGPFFWYTYKDSDDGDGDHDDNEKYFGLIRFDGSTKPAYGTFGSLISQP